MQSRLRPFIAPALMLAALGFSGCGLTAPDRLPVWKFPKLPYYTVADRAILYTVFYPTGSLFNPRNVLAINGKDARVVSNPWWTVISREGYYTGSSEYRKYQTPVDEVISGVPIYLPPGTHHFQLQGQAEEPDSPGSTDRIMTDVIKFSETIGPSEVWVLWAQIGPDGQFGYSIRKIGKCDEVGTPKAPPKSDTVAHNRYRILSRIVKDANWIPPKSIKGRC